MEKSLTYVGGTDKISVVLPTLCPILSDDGDERSLVYRMQRKSIVALTPQPLTRNYSG